MIIFHELYPDSYLLALTPAVTATAEIELAAHLARACRSGKPAVWVDCRLLDTLSDTSAWLLWSCHQRLQRRRAQLLLCGVSAPVAATLRHTLADSGAGLLTVSTLEEAAALSASRAQT